MKVVLKGQGTNQLKTPPYQTDQRMLYEYLSVHSPFLFYIRCNHVPTYRSITMFKNIGTSVTFVASQVTKVAAITNSVTSTLTTACLFAEYSIAESLEAEMATKGWTITKLGEHRKMLASLDD